MIDERQISFTDFPMTKLHDVVLVEGTNQIVLPKPDCV